MPHDTSTNFGAVHFMLFLLRKAAEAAVGKCGAALSQAAIVLDVKRAEARFTWRMP
jgi:hypothetical protein